MEFKIEGEGVEVQGATILDFKRNGGACWHNSLLVDCTLAQVTCKTCGEKLEPFFVIEKMMQLERRWARLKAEADLSIEQASKKTKTKCQHCNRITKVKTDVTDGLILMRLQQEGKL